MYKRVPPGNKKRPREGEETVYVSAPWAGIMQTDERWKSFRIAEGHPW